MFSRPFVRIILTAALAAILLVPAAQADDWGKDNAAQLDPAIAAAIHDRPSAVLQTSAARPPSTTVASTAVRPDDRAGPRGAGAAVADNAPIPTAASAGFHWADAGFGAAATLALIVVLAGLGLARAKRHRSHPILN